MNSRRNQNGPMVTIPLVPCFQGKSAWTNGPERSSKVSPETGIGPWMALPRNLRVPNCVFLTVFFRFLTSACNRGNTLQKDKTCLKTPLFSAIWFRLPLQMLTTLWTRHSERHRLENTVCYSLEKFHSKNSMRNKKFHASFTLLVGARKGT